MAGVLVTACASPVDVVRTRMMNSQQTSTAYTSYFNAITSIFRKEGPLAFYKGIVLLHSTRS